MKLKSLILATIFALVSLQANAATTLIHSGSGTFTGAAGDADTAAITGLTNEDTLVVYYSLSSATQPTAACFLRNATDGKSLLKLTPDITAIGADTSRGGFVVIRKTPLTANNVRSYGMGGSSPQNIGGEAEFTSGWTSNWNLALKIGNVTSGGTASYNWAVYKVDGQ